MLKVPLAQWPPVPCSAGVVPRNTALGSHSSEHGASRQKTVPRSSLTHPLKQRSAGKPSSIPQCSSWLLWDPPQLGAYTAGWRGQLRTAGWRGQLPTAVRDGSSCCPFAHPSSCRVVSSNCHAGCRDGAEVEIQQGHHSWEVLQSSFSSAFSGK